MNNEVFKNFLLFKIALMPISGDLFYSCIFSFTVVCVVNIHVYWTLLKLNLYHKQVFKCDHITIMILVFNDCHVLHISPPLLKLIYLKKYDIDSTVVNIFVQIAYNLVWSHR